MSRWYRAYQGTVTDAKFGELALVAGCSRSVAIACWHCILENCAETNDNGRFDLTPRRVSVILGEPIAVVAALFGEMQEMEMICGNAVAKWQKRQFASDNSTERSKKHRERQRNGDATLQQQPETPPYTDTETEKNGLSARERESAFRQSVVEAFERRGQMAPDTSHAVLWLHRGHDPQVCLSVIADTLSRKPGVRSLKYFDQAIADAHVAPVGSPNARAGPRDASAGLHSALEMLARVANGERTGGSKGDRGGGELLPFDGGEGPPRLLGDGSRSPRAGARLGSGTDG